ncbi:GDP-L-fucose synthetase (EC 1.1.1.271) [uncultured Gammaproteobacteria bacterium]|uniref:GDP-L-fucose synthase n=1 Tax=Bathymodiolus heckerae thiotrophic gill symbiont TaxID=1052212 RepID=UPI0010BBB73E|nr:GDP-L-fucose synthase [Bathymodiolus heckerae thiotrophic gill symbiont]CAC9605844.1 GDP-L-fucose synthetase (EC 1.1.1.271) [uncultured Gammaproteobacteria bacterium]CAC9608389.1 GDP-L-fucose synthetase (EC 1.1.1.271) [uncultured Gammaproteobacteria bacterium]SHN91160.1 GDP-L-fucose synthetase [Bathymodiolus heckerae thiotrophic gill symbiont]
MNLNDKIYIAGHRGLVGSAIIRQLELRGFTNILMRMHKELDLTNQAQVQSFFSQENPDYVILAAAKVGGIHANNTYPADFIYQNMMIEANVINSAFESKVKRLLFLGSTCIYPKAVEQPMREDVLLTDVLEPTNEPYALAKIAGIKLCESYNRQHGTDFRSVMPTNLYGINDNFHPENSHVIPALMQRFHQAKVNNDPEVVVWGTGNAMREFLYVDDMAQASLFVLELDEQTYKDNTQPMLSHINVGTGKDITIREMAETMKQVVGYEGKLTFDATKPDGAPKKLIDVTRLENMGWQYNIDLKDGLTKTYNWYLESCK